MAHLTGTQKKTRNKFIALLVATLLVVAAIFYVIYAAFMAKSAYLESQDFATALSVALDKSARKVSQDDLAKVKYLEAQNSGEAAYVALGYDEFVTSYNKYIAEAEAAQKAQEAGEEVPEITTELDINDLKMAEFEMDADVTALADLKYFTGAEVVSISGFTLDAETLSQFKNVKTATFASCGFDNDKLKAFAEALDLTKVEKLTFMESGIDDWSALESISDKVVLQSYGYTITEDGQLQMIPNEQTLTEYFAAQAEAEAEEEAAAEEAVEGEVVEETAEETVEAEAEQVPEETVEEAVESEETETVPEEAAE